MNNQMFYTYFKPVVKEEHFLFAGEIAQLFNIQTRTGKSADSFVSAYLQSIAKTINNYEQLYYCTRYGMTKVYEQNFYIPVIHRLISEVGYNKEVCLNINNKNYYIKVVK